MSENQPWLSSHLPADQVHPPQFRAGPHSQGPPCHQVTIPNPAPSTPSCSSCSGPSGAAAQRWGPPDGRFCVPPVPCLMPSLWPASVASSRTASLSSLAFLCSVFPSHVCVPVRDLSSAQHCCPGSGSMTAPLFHIPLLTLLSFALHLDLYFHCQCLFSSVFFLSLSHYLLSSPSWAFPVAAFLAIFPFYILISHTPTPTFHVCFSLPPPCHLAPFVSAPPSLRPSQSFYSILSLSHPRSHTLCSSLGVFPVSFRLPRCRHFRPLSPIAPPVALAASPFMSLCVCSLVPAKVLLCLPSAQRLNPCSLYPFPPF